MKPHRALVSVSKVVELLARQGMAFQRRYSGLTKKVTLSTREHLFKTDKCGYSNFAGVASIRIDAGDNDLYKHLPPAPHQEVYIAGTTEQTHPVARRFHKGSILEEVSS